MAHLRDATTTGKNRGNLQRIGRVASEELVSLQGTLLLSTPLSLAALTPFVYLGFDFLSIRSTMSDNADVLFSEDIARNLNAGGHLFDWRLSQVPYLFPDVFLARAIAYAGADVGDVAAWYSVVFGGLVLTLVYVLGRMSNADSVTVTAFALLLYIVGYFSVDFGDHIAVTFRHPPRSGSRERHEPSIVERSASGERHSQPV